jgi:hypothetical protein
MAVVLITALATKINEIYLYAQFLLDIIDTERYTLSAFSILKMSCLRP